MPDFKGKVKAIIIDKAPEGDNLSMQQTLGFVAGEYTVLADAFNLAFGTQVTADELETLTTVNDVVVFMENQSQQS